MIKGAIETYNVKQAIPEIQIRDENNSQNTLSVCFLLFSEMRLPIEAPIPSKITFINVTVYPISIM